MQFLEDMLGLSKNIRAIDELIKLLDDNDDDIRSKAVKALGMIGDKRAIPYLIKLKTDNSTNVRDAVEMSLDM